VVSVVPTPPILIAHRGLWRVPVEQNTLNACLAAAVRGWGVEIDARHQNAHLHFPPWLLEPYVNHDVGRGPPLGPFVDAVLDAGAPRVLIDAKTPEAFAWASEHLRENRVIVRVPNGMEAKDLPHNPDRTVASVFDLDALGHLPPIAYLLADHRDGPDWRTADALESAPADYAFICNSPEVVGGHLDLPWYAWNWRDAFAVMTDRPEEYERAWRGEDGFSVPLASHGLSYNPERAVVLTRFLARACGAELRAATSIVEMGARDGEMAGALVRGMGLTAKIRCEEGREEHVAWGRRKFPDFDFAPVDYEGFDLSPLPDADVVVCIGLLYHLSPTRVAPVLRHAVKRARTLVVIETEVIDRDASNGALPVPRQEGNDQGLADQEGIPSIDYVEGVLREMDVGYTRISTPAINSNQNRHRYDWRIRNSGAYKRGEQRCLWLVTP